MAAVQYSLHPLIGQRDSLSIEQQHHYYRNGIGGSDIAAICGLSESKSSFSVFLDKLGDNSEDQPYKDIDTVNQQQDMISTLFAIEHSEWTITQNKTICCHPDYRWALGNLDRLITCPNRGRGILEIKAACEYRSQEWSNDTIPDEVYVQLQWHMFVTGLEWGYFATVVNDNGYREYVVNRDQEMINQLFRLAYDFYHHYILAGVCPPVNGTKACTVLLDRLYPEANEDETIILDEIVSVETYLDNKSQLTHLEDGISHFENLYKSQLGDHLSAIVGSYQIKWENCSSIEIDHLKLKDKYPDAYHDCLKLINHRQFSVQKAF